MPMFFQHMREKSGRPGQFGDVMMTYLPLFLPLFIETVADVSSIQIDQAFFLRALKNMERPGYEARQFILLFQGSTGATNYLVR